MKPAPFDYARPDTLADALAALADAGDEAKVLAGGQSLVPLLSMRLAVPSALIDINRLPELDDVQVRDDVVRVGALARHTRVLEHRAAQRAQPLLAQALRLVAHPTIRNRGTVVGSIVHADPSGELTAVLALTGGSVRLASRTGRRTVAAADFFLGPLESATRPDEIALGADFPVLPPGAGTAFVEVSRRHGDYAVCGVAAVVRRHPDGTVRSARVAVISCSPTPTVVELSEHVADRPADDPVTGAALEAVRAAVRPQSDIHGSADYRRHLAGELTARALRTAGAAR